MSQKLNYTIKLYLLKYQIKHVNGLTFDFLFNIAKKLHEKQSFMMMGGGKGSDPLVFNDGGKPYRGEINVIV